MNTLATENGTRTAPAEQRADRAHRRRVVVTGVGAVTPLGVGAETLVDRWSAGDCGIDEGFGRCSDFEPTDFLSRKEARRADRFTQLALVAGAEALDGAGWDEEIPFDPQRVGCVVGTGIGGLGSLEEQQNVLRDKGAKAVSPLAVPLLMGNAAAAAIAMRSGLHGPSFGVMSACAAGAHAIGQAVRMIEAGEVDAIVTGGSESALCGVAIAAFAAMGATSPSGISRPFDARRDGFVMGEGAGVLVLEAADAADAAGRSRSANCSGTRRRRTRTTSRLPSHRGATPLGRSSWRSKMRRSIPARSTTSTRTAPRPRSTIAPRPRR